MTKNKNRSESIKLFTDHLVEEKNFKNLSEEVINQIKSDLLDRIEDRINVAILENMPKDKLDEFNNLLDENDNAKIQAFCQKNISNLEEILAKELMNFRNIYLNS